MENEQLIPAEIICTHHKIEYAFIHSLSSSGLIEVSMIEGKAFVDPTQLSTWKNSFAFIMSLTLTWKASKQLQACCSACMPCRRK